MNKMKYLLLLAACVMTTGFMTSCLNSDGESFDNRFTEEELDAYLTRLQGTYNGKLMFYHRGLNAAGTKDSMMLDSIEGMRWVIRKDSTITIDNFPDSIYNNAISMQTTTGNVDFRNILSKAQDRRLVCNFGPFKGLTQSNTVDYGFFVLPDGTTKNNAVYTSSQIFDENGKQYDVEYGYVTYLNDGYSYYQADGYLSSTGNISFMLILSDIKCEQVPQSNYRKEGYPILLKGMKLY
ncbi:MAG: DUF4840 domain-containing protein [Prevotella sp.]|nr:DUF4840 domain-containing protein [Prevotella sp.]